MSHSVSGATLITTGWPDPQNPGAPLNRDVSAWWWLITKAGRSPCFWDQRFHGWNYEERVTDTAADVPPEIMARHYSLGGLLHEPADRAAHDARVTELLAANNREVERRRAAEAQVVLLTWKLAEQARVKL